MIPAVTELLNKFAVAFDLPLLDWIQTHLGCAFLDKVMPIITMFGDDGIFWIACAAILLLIPSQRRNGLGMGIALMLGLIVCNMILKPVVGRIRPYDFQEQYNNVVVPLLISGLSDFSFPSGHTIASFEAAVARKPEAGHPRSDPGIPGGLLPAVPVCPLPHRCDLLHLPGHRLRLHRLRAGRQDREAPQEG